MFGTLNPKIPATRSADGTLRWSAKGLSLNLANSNTWTGAQTFSTTTTFNAAVSLNSTVNNSNDFYNYGTFNNSGTMNLNNANANDLTCTGTVEAATALRAEAASGGIYYESPNTGTYVVANFPILASSISGTDSEAYSIYDDGAGTLLSSGAGTIATIDYATGTITDTTGGLVWTFSLQYTQAPTGSYCELLPTGQATFIDAATGTSVSLNDGTYAMSAAGNLSISGDIGANAGNFSSLYSSGSATFASGVVLSNSVTQGAGAPATILTTFNLYVDTVTGIVYVD